jgi:hypothetical protein
MNADAIRILLHEYIDSASDKKVKAFYTIIEEDSTDDYDPFEDTSFVAEMDRRYNECLSDPSIGKSLDEVEQKARQILADKGMGGK